MKNNKQHIFLWSALLLLMADLTLSCFINDVPAKASLLQHIVPYAALCMAVAALASFFPKSVLCIGLLCNNIALIYEAVVGLLQVVGMRPSRHSLFVLTGTFDNPGPYGGFVAITACMSLAYVLHNRRRFTYHWLKIYRRTKKTSLIFPLVLLYTSFAAACFGLCVLPASMSRSGWIAFAVSALIASWPIIQKVKFAQHRWFRFAASVVVICALVGVWFVKRDSARGRIHIWRIEAMAISEHPLIGVGPGLEMGAYGIAQENFFGNKERPLSTIVAAGCPEYSFNEYLGIAMQGGIPALLLVLVVVVLSIIRLRDNFYPATGGLTAYAIFAFGSYPMSVPLLCIPLSVLLGLALSDTNTTTKISALTLAVASCVALLILFPHIQKEKEAKAQWRMASFLGQTEQYDRQIEAILPLYPQLHHNFRYLYDLGYALHKEQRIQESDKYLSEGLRLSSDPMFLNILGKNREVAGDDIAAEQYYQRSINRVPCRLYPRLLLIKLYKREKRVNDALKLAEESLILPVPERHNTMQDVHSQIINEVIELKEGICNN